ncbi:hypothetical protein A3D11_02270 [Candidatus Peribacteria bacterium RIFCSPHIGHO2_02_FULL_49_16]|nr:MAG: hypothetical protein A2880_03730 [Candidatus Peribacteria bacterium RIFCSPHIGHO2_01_FULL_49_38]OGJ59951.1 MAG: hypothetical protein A3D11_02270 [Candidatus Peribacteria bacterium RIFCSPHIGHO2_02_FULL_49_16]
MSPLTRILLRFILTTIFVWFMSQHLGQYFVVTGGMPATVLLGLIFTIAHKLLHPLLYLITLPLRLFATLVAIFLINGLLISIVVEIIKFLDPSLITLHISGGFIGWIAVILLFGLVHWLMKILVK